MLKTILIIYYSDSGHTKKVAEYIANSTGAVVESIETEVFGTGIWNYLKRAWCSLRKEIIPINPVINDPSQFDLVIVGAPVWAGHVANPIRSYLTEYSRKISQVAFFVTLGGSGSKGALRDMQEISGLIPIAELEITESDFKGKQDISKMASYVASIGN